MKADGLPLTPAECEPTENLSRPCPGLRVGLKPSRLNPPHTHTHTRASLQLVLFSHTVQGTVYFVPSDVAFPERRDGQSRMGPRPRGARGPENTGLTTGRSVNQKSVRPWLDTHGGSRTPSVPYVGTRTRARHPQTLWRQLQAWRHLSGPPTPHLRGSVVSTVAPAPPSVSLTPGIKWQVLSHAWCLSRGPLLQTSRSGGQTHGTAPRVRSQRDRDLQPPPT